MEKKVALHSSWYPSSLLIQLDFSSKSTTILRAGSTLAKFSSLPTHVQASDPEEVNRSKNALLTARRSMIIILSNSVIKNTPSSCHILVTDRLELEEEVDRKPTGHIYDYVHPRED